MGDVLSTIFSNPITAYVLSFAGVGIALALALNYLHGKLDFSDRLWGILTVVAGAVSGVLLQGTGFVHAPVESGAGGVVLSAFMGAIVACAAAGFSAVDLRQAITKGKD